MHSEPSLKISRLYDSHTHWLGTGQMAAALPLFHLTSSEQVRHLKVEPSHFRAHFLVGFGWDSKLWPSQDEPRKEILDEVFPNYPVFFSKNDGHFSWVNTLALKALGLPITHSGLLSEEEHFKAYSALPPFSDEQVQQALQKATAIFNQAGFTHIRDLTCDLQQWRQARALDQQGALTLYVEENFLCEAPEFLERALQDLQTAKAEQTAHLKVQGLKIFYDGTLGSDTALLSQCQCQSKSQRRSGWTEAQLEEVFKKTWSLGFEVSVHTIGDEAVHQVVTAARKVMATNAHTGWLNLEHVQVLRPETLQMMKALHVRCHMQPCHWLSDRVWLQEKLGDLYKYAFPWGALSRSGIPLFFGSDSPVAKSSFWDNQRALKESRKAKIPALKGDAVEFHTHPQPPFGECTTVFENETLKQLIFDGRIIYDNATPSSQRL